MSDNRRTSVRAEVDSTDDFLNTYAYDNLGRLVTVQQVAGCHWLCQCQCGFNRSRTADDRVELEFRLLPGGRCSETSDALAMYADQTNSVRSLFSNETCFNEALAKPVAPGAH